MEDLFVQESAIGTEKTTKEQSASSNQNKGEEKEMKKIQGKR